MRRSLIYYGHPLLRKKAKTIDRVTDEIRQLAQDLIDLMLHHNGVGIAAPQVGVLLRIFIIRDEGVSETGAFQLQPPEVLINPEITQPVKEMEVMAEGCLSIPGLHAEVKRPSRIKIRYLTLEGEVKEEEASHFRARVMMHENDHLNGVLFIDRLPPDIRKKLDPKLREIKERYS
jgi:peptide deformylase